MWNKTNNQTGKKEAIKTQLSKASTVSRNSKNSKVAKNSKSKNHVVKSTLFAATSLEIIKAKIIKNRATLPLVISSEKEIKKEMEALKIDTSIEKNIKTIRKNKAFLGLVDTWTFKVLEIANSLTDYMPSEDNRLKMKKSLDSKIRQFRVDNVPLTKHRYSG